MLFVRDKGQMGNNILLYGHVYAWAREHGRTAVSLRFAYKYPYFRICKTRWHNYLVYLAVKYLGKMKKIPIIEFHVPRTPYEEIDQTLANSGTAIIEGWAIRFYDLFLKYRKEIAALFSFLPHIEKSVHRFMTKEEGTDADNAHRLGVHIRRGDYARHMGGKFYYDDDTYITLIKQWLDSRQDTEEKSRQAHIYICTNDNKLNKKKYITALPEAHLHFPKGNAGEDLCLLSKMDCIIGPPSTYSLVASMYRDLPIYFIREATAPLHFHRFEDYFYYDDERTPPKF